MSCLRQILRKLQAFFIKVRHSKLFTIVTVYFFFFKYIADYGCPERKQPSLHGRKFTPTPTFLVTAKAYFVCHIGPNFQIRIFDLCLHVCSPCIVYLISAQTSQEEIKCMKAKELLRAYCPNIYTVNKGMHPTKMLGHLFG